MPAAFKQALEDLKPIRLPAGSKSNPVLVYDVKAVYPPEARTQKLEGVVEVEVIIDRDGQVAQARITGPVEGLNEAALDAVRQWRFQPALMNGEPTAVVCSVEISFRLK